MPRHKRRHDHPPAMAKPSRQWPSPSAAPSAARGRRDLSRRCLSPPGRVSTRPAERGWSEGIGASRRCGRGRFFIHLSCRHKKDGRPPGRDPANHRQPKAPQKPNGKDQKPWTPACAGTTNFRRPCPGRRHHIPPGKPPQLSRRISGKAEKRLRCSPRVRPSRARARSAAGSCRRRCAGTHPSAPPC